VNPRNIIELAAAQWVGLQESNDGTPLVLFRDPVTRSTLCLLEEDLTVDAVLARLEVSRKLFGVKA
jgi:hypothetical protein